MKIAIMQPYIFPYIGYFQLINAVDKFVIYDDVNYINRGWINRNNILMNGESSLFTIPLREASQNKLIRHIEIDYTQKWQNKILKTLQIAYSKARHFEKIYPMLEDLINMRYDNISQLNLFALKKILEYLNINSEIIESSSIYQNDYLKSQDRIIDICKKEKAEIYINPTGGIELYKKEQFTEQGLQLNFIKSNDVEYTQFNNKYIPWLSIIDVLMFNSIEEVNQLLYKYKLQ